MAQEAASRRATHRFSPPDALVIGTGIACQVGHLVTNDGEWERKLGLLRASIPVCMMSRFLPFP